MFMVKNTLACDLLETLNNGYNQKLLHVMGFYFKLVSALSLMQKQLPGLLRQYQQLLNTLYKLIDGQF